MMGLSTRGSISLGMALVAGKNRVPNPAAGKTALRTFASIPSQFRSSERPYASGRTERVPQSDILEPVGGFSSLEYRGCRLAYRVTGAGPPLVWIQGVGAQGLAVNPQVDRLKGHFTCLTFDNRGIGASQPSGVRLS